MDASAQKKSTKSCLNNGFVQDEIPTDFNWMIFDSADTSFQYPLVNIGASSFVWTMYGEDSYYEVYSYVFTSKILVTVLVTPSADFEAYCCFLGFIIWRTKVLVW